MKPTREELGRWAARGPHAPEGCTARYALDLEREVESLGKRCESLHELYMRRVKKEMAPPPAPSPLLYDAFWRRVFAALVRAGVEASTTTYIEDNEKCSKYASDAADALLAAMHKRDGKP